MEQSKRVAIIECKVLREVEKKNGEDEKVFSTTVIVPGYKPSIEKIHEVIREKVSKVIEILSPLTIKY